jgi:hypothetical protein
MTVNLTLSPKIRNSLAEIVSIAGLLVAALPQIAADVHVPQWAGAVLALVVTVGNQLLKDSTIPPSLTETPSLTVGQVPVVTLKSTDTTPAPTLVTK